MDTVRSRRARGRRGHPPPTPHPKRPPPPVTHYTEQNEPRLCRAPHASNTVFPAFRCRAVRQIQRVVSPKTGTPPAATFATLSTQTTYDPAPAPIPNKTQNPPSASG